MSTESKMKIGDVVRSKAHTLTEPHPRMTIHSRHVNNWQCRILSPDGTYKLVEFNEAELELVSNT